MVSASRERTTRLACGTNTVDDALRLASDCEQVSEKKLEFTIHKFDGFGNSRCVTLFYWFKMLIGMPTMFLQCWLGGSWMLSVLRMASLGQTLVTGRAVLTRSAHASFICTKKCFCENIPFFVPKMNGLLRDVFEQKSFNLENSI